MKTAYWYFVERGSVKATESDTFENIIVTSMQNALDSKMYHEALVSEYLDLTEAMKQGRGGPREQRMLSRCMRALKKIQ